jgi:hypothetical protein
MTIEPIPPLWAYPASWGLVVAGWLVVEGVRWGIRKLGIGRRELEK